MCLEWGPVVYCTKCGTKNEESAETCVKCGADLYGLRGKNWEKRLEEGAEEFGRRAEVWAESYGRRAEDDCFGLPHGGSIFGIIIGIIIIIGAVLILAGINLEIWWPLIIVLFGALILIGAIYNLTRKRKRY